MLGFKRTLFLQKGGETKIGELFVGNVHWSSTKQKWGCEWSISYLHPEIGVIYGNDGLDAFVKAMDFLSIYIRGTETDGIAIWWQQPGDHAGVFFPLSEDRKWEKTPPRFTGASAAGDQKQ